MNIVLETNAPTMLDHWQRVYTKAYWDEHDNLPIERSSLMHRRAHEAGLKAVIVADVVK